MSADLGLDARVQALEAVTASAVGFADRVEALLRAIARSDENPFGSAALLDAGAAAGEVPVIGAGGTLSAALLPSVSVPAPVLQTAMATVGPTADRTASFIEVSGPEAAYDVASGRVRVLADGIYLAVGSAETSSSLPGSAFAGADMVIAAGLSEVIFARQAGPSPVSAATLSAIVSASAADRITIRTGARTASAADLRYALSLARLA